MKYIAGLCLFLMSCHDVPIDQQVLRDEQLKFDRESAELRNEQYQRTLAQVPDPSPGPAEAPPPVVPPAPPRLASEMTLREWYAGQALAGNHRGLNIGPDEIAGEAFVQADAMLRAEGARR